MRSGLHTLYRSRACAGEHVVVGGEVVPEPALALAGLLGELESDGLQIPVVSLRVARRSDVEWVQPALRWLHAHGRRPLLRAAVSPPKALAEAAWECGATVILELGHHQPAIQRALLGPEVDASAGLLLEAQHLIKLGVGVAAHLGPLLPGLHDRRGHLEPLLRHVRAASIHDVHLAVGRLTPARLRALDAAVDEATALGIRRSFGVRAGDHGESWRGGARQLPRLAAAALREGVRALVREHGLHIDACGCSAQCHLDGGGRPDYTPIDGGELFAGIAS
ncbi:MAG: hypothetical protein R3A79_24130 [Nannocystaceae bacterium]